MSVNASRRLLLADLPPEVIERITTCLPQTQDLASANATSRLFRGAPGTRSAVEFALRERAKARGHLRVLPAELPPDVCSWTEKLLARERVIELAREHARVAVSGGLGKGSMSAFVDADGGLHTCGEVTEYDNAGGRTGRFVPVDALGHPELQAVLVPTRVTSLGSVRVCAVAAGWQHLLALTECGSVYVCGHSHHGQLGLGDTETRRSFAPLEALSGQVIVHIAAGAYHSVALSAAGTAYSWGDNNEGQLGHGDTEERWEPRRIEALDGVPIGGTSAGCVHSLFLSVSGAVFSCGDGTEGRLGHGDEQHQHAPRRITALAGVRAVHVSAGVFHNLVVDAAGGVHSFGAGWRGCLGHDDEATQFSPKRIEALAGVRAVRASAGSYYRSAVVGADGRVHTFGYNGCGVLGLGQPAGELLAPERTHGLAHERVVACSLGDAHTLFVTADGVVHSCGVQSGALGHGVSAAAQTEQLGMPTRIAQLPRMQRPGHWLSVAPCDSDSSSALPSETFSTPHPRCRNRDRK